MPNLFTIITICRNSEGFIEKTIRSVISQDCKDYEYIIVDGASTDATLDIIKKYNNDITKWVSEPDMGIADAMNKGINLASGEYILFLHSDDYLLSDNILGDIKNAVTDAKIQIFELFYQRGTELQKYRPRGFNFWMWFKYGILHQATLCHASVFKEIGKFDTNFKIAMDYDFFLRAYTHGISLQKHLFPVSIMRDTGVSSQLDWKSLKYRFYEERMAQKKNNPTLAISTLHHLFWPPYILYRKVKSILLKK